MPRVKQCDLKPGQWIDGAGKVQDEMWIVLIEKMSRVSNVQYWSQTQGNHGTRESAEESLNYLAGSYGKSDRLSIARVFEPEIVHHEATVTWGD